MYPSGGCQPGAGLRHDRPEGHHVDDPYDLFKRLRRS